MIEGVVHAVNSDIPELVLASELEKSVEGWNVVQSLRIILHVMEKKLQLINQLY